MAGYRKQIGSHIFYNAQDYEDALYDEKLIEEIRKKINFKDSRELVKLYQTMQSGAISFRSVLGREFDDEVYEAIQKIKAKERASAKSEDLDNGRKRGNGKTEHTGSVKEPGTGYTDNGKVEEEARKILSVKDRRRRVVMILCSLVAVVCLGYFAYYYTMSYKSRQAFDDLSQLKAQDGSAIPDQTVTIQGTEDEEEVVLTVLDEYKTLYNKNKSLIGWLKIADTNGEEVFIDYPVMQSPDKEYYLTHNFYQEYDKNGSIFLDPECDVVHRSTNLIIYGHHMKSGEMFGNLDRYSSEAFFENHRYIQFDTIYEKGTYEVMYVFRSRIYNEDEIVFKYYQFINVDSEAEFYSNMNEMAQMSLYDTGVSAVYGDELLTLSTCDYQETNGRFVVVAKRIE